MQLRLELEVILVNSISKKIILLIAAFSFGSSQNFKINNLKEIVLPDNSSVKRVQLSPSGKWLALESMPGGGRFKGYIVNLDDPSNIIPIKKSFKSSRSLFVQQIKWSTRGEEIFYFNSKNQIGIKHFYSFDLGQFNKKMKYIDDDLGKKIFNKHDVFIQSFAVNNDYDKDWFIFAKKNENEPIAISYYVDNNLEDQKVYSEDVTINHFNSSSEGGLAFVKLDEKTKLSKIVMLRYDDDYSSTVEWKREKEVDEISPKFSINDSRNYLAFLANENPGSEIFNLWLLNSPLDEQLISQKKLAGPLKTSRDDISFDDQNFAWHPKQNVIFYIKDSEDTSNPIHFYNVKTSSDKRLVTNTSRNKYLQIVGNKIVFTSMGKTSDTKRYARKAYVGDLVIYP